jgi:hypothetical protein
MVIGPVNPAIMLAHVTFIKIRFRTPCIPVSARARKRGEICGAFVFQFRDEWRQASDERLG